MTDPVSRLVEAIDRKDAEGIRDAYAPDARLVAMAPDNFYLMDGADAVAAKLAEWYASWEEDAAPTRSSARSRTATAPSWSSSARAPTRARPGWCARPTSCSVGPERHRGAPHVLLRPAPGRAGAGRRVRGGGVMSARGARGRARRRPHPPPRRPARHDGAGPARARTSSRSSPRRATSGATSTTCAARAGVFHAVNRDKRGHRARPEDPGRPGGDPGARRGTPTCSCTASRRASPSASGIGLAEMEALNPRLVYCSLSAFGPDGAQGHRRRPAGRVGPRGRQRRPPAARAGPRHHRALDHGRRHPRGAARARAQRARPGRRDLAARGVGRAGRAPASSATGPASRSSTASSARSTAPTRRPTAASPWPATPRRMHERAAARPRPGAPPGGPPLRRPARARAELRRAGPRDRRPAGHPPDRPLAAHPGRRRPAPRRGERAAALAARPPAGARAGPAGGDRRPHARHRAGHRPAAAAVAHAGPHRAGPAPRLGEHTGEVLDELRERRS